MLVAITLQKYPWNLNVQTLIKDDLFLILLIITNWYIVLKNNRTVPFVNMMGNLRPQDHKKENKQH